MRFRRLASAVVQLGLSLLATATAAASLDPAALPAAWSTRLAALAPPPALVASFVERRETPLKKIPVTVHGTARLARDHGLSLDYAQPLAPLVILDARGLLLRHPDGRLHTPPPEAAASTRLLHALFTLDFVALAPDYALSGESAPPAEATDAWTLVFTRRPGSTAFYRELGLAGDATRLTRIRLVRAERQITIIELAPPKLRDAFSPQDLARWFR
jgi:hypothetical protein